MSDLHIVASRDEAKAMAVDLRKTLSVAGETISHAEALERVAKQLGYRDWNTASARLPDAALAPFQIGQMVEGKYLGQAFRGRLIAVSERNNGKLFDVTVDFEKAVDVVKWDSFSSHRKRVNAKVQRNGVSLNKTSDGQPHLIIG